MDIKQNHNPHQFTDLDSTNFMSIVDQFDEGIVVSDHGGMIVYYNDRMSKIMDLLPEFVIEKGSPENQRRGGGS